MAILCMFMSFISDTGTLHMEYLVISRYSTIATVKHIKLKQCCTPRFINLIIFVLYFVRSSV